MFEDKKQAEEHDKYLELAANITHLIEAEIDGVSEAHSEAIGLLLAKRRELLAKACKGKPELLLEPFEETESLRMDAGKAEEESQEATDKITALAANQ